MLHKKSPFLEKCVLRKREKTRENKRKREFAWMKIKFQKIMVDIDFSL